MLPILLSISLAGTIPGPAAGVPVDWGARLHEDATSFRSAVLDSHPAPAGPEATAFVQRLDLAYAQVLRRASTSTSFAHYEWALAELTAAFDDGHLGIDPGERQVAAHPPTYRWPGFVTALRGQAHVVVHSEGPSTPAVGARLVACDGIGADALAADRIGRFEGRWMLRSRRIARSALLFLPFDNPWLKPVVRCRFEIDGRPVVVPLRWRSIDEAARRRLFENAVGKRHRSPVAMERLDDGSFWISMGSFDGDPASATGRQLTALNTHIANEAPALRTAPRVVFDLRGNNGGSSAWLKQAVRAIWGEAAPGRRAAPTGRVDWRVSDANIQVLRRYRASFETQRATNPAPFDWAVKVLGGLEAARDRGDRLWSQPQEPEQASSRSDEAYPVRANVFVLTDFACASACLDAVDLLTSLGAVQVGQETAADTMYMEVREQQLPSGAQIYLPMKVYRGRARGSNVPAVPRFEWTGGMGDTTAIRRWLATLQVAQP